MRQLIMDAEISNLIQHNHIVQLVKGKFDYLKEDMAKLTEYNAKETIQLNALSLKIIYQNRLLLYIKKLLEAGPGPVQTTAPAPEAPQPPVPPTPVPATPTVPTPERARKFPPITINLIGNLTKKERRQLSKLGRELMARKGTRRVVEAVEETGRALGEFERTTFVERNLPTALLLSRSVSSGVRKVWGLLRRTHDRGIRQEAEELRQVDEARAAAAGTAGEGAAALRDAPEVETATRQELIINIAVVPPTAKINPNGRPYEVTILIPTVGEELIFLHRIEGVPPFDIVRYVYDISQGRALGQRDNYESDESEFKITFTPQQPGNYIWEVVVLDKRGIQNTARLEFFIRERGKPEPAVAPLPTHSAPVQPRSPPQTSPNPREKLAADVASLVEQEGLSPEEAEGLSGTLSKFPGKRRR